MGSLHSWNLKLFFVVSGENLVPNRKPNFQMLSVQRPRSVSHCYFILKRVARPSRCEVVVHAHDLMAFCKQPPTNVRAWIGQVWCVLHPLTQTQCSVILSAPLFNHWLGCGPRKPAPPVTSMRLNCALLALSLKTQQCLQQATVQLDPHSESHQPFQVQPRFESLSALCKDYVD